MVFRVGAGAVRRRVLVPEARRLHLVLSVEHATNRVPVRFADCFDSAAARRALASHRGCDLGALFAGRVLARRFGVPLHASSVTRLLVDANRSLGHPGLFSEFSRRLDQRAREEILRRYYEPHRERVAAAVAQSLRRGLRVVHVSVHSFAPVLRGQVRRADVGLLYDPARDLERALCHGVAQALGALDPSLRVRQNYPYRGAADGLTTAFRGRFRPGAYLGIELELNQACLAVPPAARGRFVGLVGNALAGLLWPTSARPRRALLWGGHPPRRVLPRCRHPI